MAQPKSLFPDRYSIKLDDLKKRVETTGRSKDDLFQLAIIERLGDIAGQLRVISNQVGRSPGVIER
jgi:hypothetical protein